MLLLLHMNTMYNIHVMTFYVRIPFPLPFSRGNETRLSMSKIDERGNQRTADSREQKSPDSDKRVKANRDLSERRESGREEKEEIKTACQFGTSKEKISSISLQRFHSLQEAFDLLSEQTFTSTLVRTCTAACDPEWKSRNQRALTWLSISVARADGSCSRLTPEPEWNHLQTLLSAWKYQRHAGIKDTQHNNSRRFQGDPLSR